MAWTEAASLHLALTDEQDSKTTSQIVFKGTEITHMSGALFVTSELIVIVWLKARNRKFQGGE